MFCGKCGSEVNEASSFCGNCGAKIEKIVEPPRAGLRKSNFVGGRGSSGENASLGNTPEKALTNLEAPLIKSNPIPVAQEPVVKQEPIPVVQEPIVKQEPIPVIQEPIVRQEPIPVAQEPVVKQEFNYEEIPLGKESVFADDVINKSSKVSNKSRTAKKGRRIVMNVVSVIICILIFIITTAMMFSIALRMWLSSNNIENIVGDIEEKAVAEAIIENVEGFDELSRAEQKYQTKQLELVIKETSVDELVVELANNYTGYIMNGEAPKEITSDTILKYIRRDSEKIEDIYGIELTESVFLDIEHYLDDNLDVLDPISKDVVDNPIVNVLKVICSKAFIVVFAILDLLLLLWLFFARKWSIGSLGWFAVPTLISSLLVVAVMFFPVEAFLNPSVAEFADPVLDNIKTKALIQGIVGIAVSVLFFVISIVNAKLKKRKSKNA